MTPAPVSTTPDDAVAALVAGTSRVSVVGVSDRFTRPSFRVAAYLLDRTAWTVTLVNPHVVETLGRACTPVLPEGEDVVLLFRGPVALPGAVDDAVAARAGAVWLPTGTDRSDTPGPPADPAALEAALARAAAAGVVVVAGRDLREDHRRWGR